MKRSVVWVLACGCGPGTPAGFSAPVDVSADTDDIGSIVVADFDGDGRPDLAFTPGSR